MFNDIATITHTIETTPKYDRLRTHINDQNAVRDYYMNQVSMGKAIAAVAYLIDILMDMNITTMNDLKAQGKLTPEQIATLDKIIYYHSQLTSLTLESNKWELDWIYGEVKLQQNQLNYEFFQKRTELQLGEPLP